MTKQTNLQPEISSNLFNVDKSDYNVPSLLLGQKKGLMDSVHQHYPDIMELFRRLLSLNWSPYEFDFKPCNAEFKSCSKSVYEMMMLTLRWQWEMDTIVHRSISTSAIVFASSSELECMWNTIAYNECLTPNHEVLTPNGWKFINEITKKDKVAQWDHDTAIITFVNPIDIITIKEYDGLMYEFSDKTGNILQTVTPNHRMPLIDNYDEAGVKSKFEYAYAVIYDECNAIPVSGYLINEECPLINADLSPVEKLYVAIQSIGFSCNISISYEEEKVEHYYQVKFTKKYKRINHLFELCEEAKWKIEEVNNDAPFKHHRTFNIFPTTEDYKIGDIISSFSWIDLEKINGAWICGFFNEIKYWNNYKAIDNFTIIFDDLRCADMFSTLSHMSDRTSRIKKKYSKNSGGVYYKVYVYETNYINGSYITKKEINYKGNVHCLTVPSSYFLVRNNDSISVTGNCIHALTYSEIVRNSFDDPEQVLIETLSIPESLKRLETVTKVLNDAYIASNYYAVSLIDNDEDLYHRVFMYIIAIFAIERIQFMASFAVTFAIGEAGLFTPIAKSIQKIAQDEFEVHVSVDKAILRHELNTNKGMAAYNYNKNLIKNLFDEVLEAEFNWTDFLFSEGRELVGITPDLLKKWVLWCAKDAYTFLDISCDYSFPDKNPLPFMDNWLQNNQQGSPQEEKSVAYMLGFVVKDDENQVFDDNI